MKTKGVFLAVALLAYLGLHAEKNNITSPVSFSLVCPHDVTVSCDEDLTDLDKWGTAYVWKDYKRISAGTPTIDKDVNGCGIGTITRTWRVQDPYFIWHTCSQVITIHGTGLFSEHDITWPQSWTVDTCGIDLHPRNLPYDYAYPRFARVDCSMPAYSYKDEYFDFGPHCKKLVRTWKVIDWCQHSPYPGSTQGKWEYIQILKVDQKERPQFECPRDTIFYASDCDSADIVLDDVFAIGKCGDTLSVYNMSPFSDDAGNNASGRYPIGIHEVKYIAEYGCGREVKCIFNIEVRPAKPPTPYCKNGIITTLMPMDTNRDGTVDNGMREVWASDLNAGSYHDCYNDMPLIYSFSADTSDQVIVFDCDNVGTNEVEIWVTDTFGNQAYCITYIVVQSNHPDLVDCMPDSLRTGTIAGSLSLFDGRMIKEVEVSVFGENADMQVRQWNDTIIDQNGNRQIIVRRDTSWYDMTIKDMAKVGDYSFEDLSRHKDYQVSASKSDQIMNGVDIWDYYSMYFHVSRLIRISDPVVLLSADINNDGKVNWVDVGLVLEAIMDPSQANQVMDGWRFFDKKCLLEYQQDPSTQLQSNMAVNDLDGHKVDVDFVGIKVGDINNSVDPTALQSTLQTRSNELCDLNFKRVGGSVEMKLERSVVIGDIILDIDINKVHEVTLGDRPAQVVEYNGRTRIIALHAEGSSIIRMSLDESAVIDGNVLDPRSVIYDNNKNKYSLNHKGGTETFDVTVYPNPAVDKLFVSLNTPQSNKVDIMVTNQLGQNVMTITNALINPGNTLLELDVNSLPAGNMYFVKIVGCDDQMVSSFLK